MKTLILTSAGMVMREEILRVLPGPANMMKVAYITTASKPEKDKTYVINDKTALIEAGFIVEDVDIENFGKKELLDKLMSFDIVYVQGGNTFYLMNVMHKCDFADVIREVLDAGIIYIGVSAGSIVAGPDIAIAGWKDADPNDVGLTDLTGLFLVNFGVYPHFKDEISQEVGREIVNAPYDVKFLHDDEALLVLGNKVTLLKTEVKLD